MGAVLILFCIPFTKTQLEILILMKTFSRIIIISITDLTLILRDKSLLLLLFVPFLILLVLQLLVPFLTGFVPVLPEYYTLIVALTAVVSSLFPGFIMAFIILDEKEQYLTDVFKVLPWSINSLLMVRIALSSLTGFIYSLIILTFSGLYEFTNPQIIYTSVLNAFASPIMAILVLIFSQNKIEGVVYTKVFNFILMLPVASFFINEFWRYAFGLIPNFWSFELLFSNNSYHLLFIIGLLINLTCVSVIYRILARKLRQV